MVYIVVAAYMKYLPEYPSFVACILLFTNKLKYLHTINTPLHCKQTLLNTVYILILKITILKEVALFSVLENVCD